MATFTQPIVVLTALILTGVEAGAQSGSTETKTTTMQIPGANGASLLELTVESPERVRAGRDYQYQVRVRNVSEDFILEDVALHRTTKGGVSIEGSGSGPDSGSGQQGSNRGDRPGSSGDGSDQQGGSSEGPSKIGRLEPGQSKVLSFSAVAEQQGQGRACFYATYQPVMCVVTEVVKAELSVTKKAPESRDICQPLQVTYTVENTGGARLQGVTLTDELSPGLRTTEGRETVQRDIGALDPGQSKEVTVDLQATKTGTFNSRALAKSEGDVTARSNKVETRITQAKLGVSIDGEENLYIDRPATYLVTLTNQGDGPALDTQLSIEVDERVKLVKTSKSSRGEIIPSRTGERGLTWNVGELPPGESTRISFTVNLTGISEQDLTRTNQSDSDAIRIKHEVLATSRCANAASEEIRKAAEVQTTAEAELITLPALRLSMIDLEDQVAIGETVTYQITVVNQGSDFDNDLRVTCELPEGLTFEDASGPTQAKADGQKVIFAPVETLQPGERLQWKMRAKPTDSIDTPGQISTRANLDSEFLSTPAAAVEPTTILPKSN